jgi:hypothetical protein
LISDPDRARRASVQPRGSRGAAGSGRSPFKPVAIGVVSIIGVFLVAALVLRGRPELAFERLGAVPLLGRLIGGDHLLVWRLQFGGVESTVERIKGERSALVVSGHVVNTTNETLRIIEVEGLLLSDGVERMRKVVKAANQSRKTIRDLSSSEIDMLLRLEPNRRFRGTAGRIGQLPDRLSRSAGERDRDHVPHRRCARRVKPRLRSGSLPARRRSASASGVTSIASG